MEKRVLKHTGLTDETIKGYGRWVRLEQQDAAAQMPEFSFWNKLAIVDHGSMSIGLVHATKQPEMVSTIFEQHVQTTETLIPADGNVVLVLARSRKDDAKAIDLDSVKAFVLSAGEAIVLDRGTWHFAPHALSGSVKVWVLFENDTPVNDLLTRHVDEENGIRFVIEG